VREVSAIAIQKVWRKMKEFTKVGSPVDANQVQESKEVLRAMQNLKAIRLAPLAFEQDFSARVESKIWGLSHQVESMSTEVKESQEATRNMVLKEMALIQGRMVKTMLDEMRASASNRGTPDAAQVRAGKSPKKSGSKGTPQKKGTGAGNVFSTLSVAKKRAAPIRSRRLSRD
jgi:hypothetical protein